MNEVNVFMHVGVCAGQVLTPCGVGLNRSNLVLWFIYDGRRRNKQLVIDSFWVLICVGDSIHRTVQTHRVGNPRDDNRQRIACRNGKAHYATGVFGAATIQERRIPDLFESQIGRRSVVLVVVVYDV